MRTNRSLILILPGIVAALAAPLQAQQRWLRGNTHVHSTNSGGNASPADVARWYRENGYDFLVMTDYDQRTSVDGLSSSAGEAHVFLVIPGEELRDRVAGRPLHMTAINVASAVRAYGGATMAEAITSDAAAITAASGLPVFNHPNGLLRAAITAREFLPSKGVSLFEVCCQDYRGGSGVASTEQLWDAVLSTGRILYAVAGDDAHHVGGTSRETGNAWVMVRADSLTASAIVRALAAGHFYATTGVAIDDYHSDSSGVRMQLHGVGDYGFRTYFIGQSGRILKRDETAAPSYRFRAGDTYVRARIERSDGVFAWTQPVFKRGN